MATIEQRINPTTHKVSFRVKIRRRGHPSISASFDSKTAAKQFAIQTEAAIRENRYFKTIHANKHTLAELINRYIKAVLPHKKDKQNLLIRLNFWRTHLGSYFLSEVTAPLVAGIRDKQLAFKNNKPLSGATINRYLSTLSSVLSYGVRELEWLDDNIMRKVNRRNESSGRTKFYNKEQVQSLLRACEASRNRSLKTIFVIAISTGMRLSEIMYLTFENVHLSEDGGYAILEDTKNGESRFVPITGLALELLIKINNYRKTGLLFPSRRDKNRPMNFRSAWLCALKRANVQGTFHSNRHSTASFLVAQGFSLYETGTILGHKNPNTTTKRYSHLSLEHNKQLLATISKIVFGV